MDTTLLKRLDKVLDDVIDVLNETGWEDEAEWYGDLRAGLLTHPSDSPQFTELLVELEQSFLGLGSFMDIPLSPELAEATEVAVRLAAIDTHQQRLGLASCACGIIHQIKKAD